jgi:hypothetical protein
MTGTAAGNVVGVQGDVSKLDDLDRLFAQHRDRLFAVPPGSPDAGARRAVSLRSRPG